MPTTSLYQSSRILTLRACTAGLVVLFLASSPLRAQVAVEKPAAPRAANVRVTGVIKDAETEEPIPARVYLEDTEGNFLLLDPAGEAASVFHYRIERGESREVHTAVSAAGFQVDLAPGTYVMTVERGKEYVPATREIKVTGEPLQVEIAIRRWIDMSARGWFSGDTHIHLPWQQVALPLAAEDLNVGIPITYWATDTSHTPVKQNRATGPPPKSELIHVAEDRVIWPVNTEYEIFSVDGTRHTLGAFFVINHGSPLETSVPPITETIKEARRQGALLDLDKHNWPWSMMLLPVAGIDLYELSNNHVWRAPFLFGDWYPEYVADYMGVELDADGKFTEQGWLDFGFENYYTLLNCGFRIRPTAGTAVGVHPVPMGFGRVYVHLEGPFDYDAWIEGLGLGRSFVSTGPMLDVRFDGELPGHEFAADKARAIAVTGEIDSLHPIDRIEIIRNGELAAQWKPTEQERDENGYHLSFSRDVSLDESGWLAVRCYEDRPDHRPRFAHSGPAFVTVDEQPIRPRRVEVEYLIDRVSAEIQRHRGVLDEASLQEFEKALEFYRSLLARSRS